MDFVIVILLLALLIGQHWSRQRQDRIIALLEGQHPPKTKAQDLRKS